MTSLTHQFNKTSASFIELISNRVLQLDAESSQRLIPLKDKLIRIELNDLNLSYDFIFPGQTLVVLNASERSPSAVISGKLNAFIAAASAENSGDSIFTGELHFSGEIGTARKFQELAQSLDLDWQQPLSEWFGDIPGHFIAQGLHGLSSFVQSTFSSLRQNIPEYLQEETRTTPSNCELDLFYENVDRVRSQTDRLAARINRLVSYE